ncbi:MAG: NAD(P)H-hydrate dehydratase [Thermoplasmata archaeon]
MIPFEEVRVLDKNAEYLGVPTSQLMENAGKRIADTLLEEFGIQGRRVVFICGTGNNGGDAFVAARILHGTCKTVIVLAKPKESIGSEISRKNLERYDGDVQVGVDSAASEIEKSDVIVDAILGIGVKGEVREPLRSLINLINDSGKPVLSVDVPSGLGSDTAIIPTVTVTFHDVKIGMNEKNSGRIITADIGIPEDAEKFTGPGELVYYPLPAMESHKGDNGRLLVVGGGPFTGAPALAGLSALRMGCDLARIATPESVWRVIASFSPDLIVRPLEGEFLNPGNLQVLLSMVDDVDAVVIGPGLGREGDTLRTVRDLVSELEIPFLVDADGITAVAEDLSVIRGKRCIVTPHAAEFKRLSGIEIPKKLDDRIGVIDSFSKENDIVVLLKGPVDVIAGEGRLKLNSTGNEAMTVGGTGDVLSGICGSLLSRGVGPFNTARIGAFVSGSAGDLAFEKLGYGLLPTDIISEIPDVLNAHLKR